jgi:hypothetical protein
VGSFVEDTSFEYFISFKGLYTSNTDTDFGKITINSIVYDSEGNLDPSITNLFADSASITPTFIE